MRAINAVSVISQHVEQSVPRAVFLFVSAVLEKATDCINHVITSVHQDITAVSAGRMHEHVFCTLSDYSKGARSITAAFINFSQLLLYESLV